MYFSFKYLGFAGLTLCALALYGVLLAILIRTGRLPKSSIQSFYGWSQIQILYSFLNNGASGIAKCFYCIGPFKLELFIENIAMSVIALAIDISSVFLLLALLSIGIGKRPEMSRICFFQIIILFVDLCVLIGCALLVASRLAY